MDYTNKKITLDDGSEQIVIEQVDFNRHTYLYIANLANEDDTRFVEIKDDMILNINPILFSAVIFPRFIKKFQEYD